MGAGADPDCEQLSGRPDRASHFRACAGDHDRRSRGGAAPRCRLHLQPWRDDRDTHVRSRRRDRHARAPGRWAENAYCHDVGPARQHLRADGGALRYRGRLSHQPSRRHDRARRGGGIYAKANFGWVGRAQDHLGAATPGAGLHKPADQRRPLRRAHRLRTEASGRTLGGHSQCLDLRRLRVLRYSEERHRRQLRLP